MGDLDADGDLDVVLTNGNGTVRIYRNEAERGGRWLRVRAVEPRSRRDALGARIEVRAGGRSWVRRIRPAHGYLSASDVHAHFGLGPRERVDEIRVRWPDGRQETFAGGPTERTVIVERGRGRSD